MGKVKLYIFTATYTLTFHFALLWLLSLIPFQENIPTDEDYVISHPVQGTFYDSDYHIGLLFQHMQTTAKNVNYERTTSHTKEDLEIYLLLLNKNFSGMASELTEFNISIECYPSVHQMAVFCDLNWKRSLAWVYQKFKNNTQEYTSVDFSYKNGFRNTPVNNDLLLTEVKGLRLKEYADITDFYIESVCVDFTRIGFNRDKTEALLYMGYIDGPRSGSGDWYIFEKSNGIWKIRERFNIWIS